MPGMLHLLAITSCDDGAIVDVSIRSCQDDPEMVEVTHLSRRTEMEQRGWTGFSSDSL
ncbi:MAG: hypothetical protein JWP44_4550 [Mucilaginibacter sp.]|jgi:hypothetical protein|nr:hypothetical protein [Mucilaginibacter sp.]